MHAACACAACGLRGGKARGRGWRMQRAGEGSKGDQGAGHGRSVLQKSPDHTMSAACGLGGASVWAGGGASRVHRGDHLDIGGTLGVRRTENM